MQHNDQVHQTRVTLRGLRETPCYVCSNNKGINTMKMINFDIAQALVNYVARDGNIDSLAWGNLTATKIREKLCEIRTKNNKVSFQLICKFFAENQTCKMIGGANKKINYLKILMKDASNT